jgi:hypothetical protein
LRSSSWTDRFPFLADLAALEGAVLHALLCDVSPRCAAADQLTFSGTLSLLDCRYAVVSLWRGRPALPRTKPATRRQRLAVSRNSNGVQMESLSQGEWSLLTELQAGRTLETACCQLAALERVPTPAAVCHWFERWVADGVIVDFPAAVSTRSVSVVPEEMAG